MPGRIYSSAGVEEKEAVAEALKIPNDLQPNQLSSTTHLGKGAARFLQ